MKIEKKAVKTETVKKERAPRKPGNPAARAAARIGRLGVRLDRLRQGIEGWAELGVQEAKDAVQALNEADGAIDKAAGALASLPEGWKPRKRSAAGGTVTLGTMVEITDKRRAEWAELLEASEMVGLTVEKLAGSKLQLKTQAGGRIFLPRGHVRPQTVQA